ncbi:MAG: peptidyl-dipeptidase Dcp [Xanthomonadaceae bacterium]|nr:peptidyl-dipeptidase Dcp [Xanthomonadaceae bacterium]
MPSIRLLATATAVALGAAVASAAAAPAANPFFARSTLPFQAPPFDKIKDADYQPALEEGMKRHLAEIGKIANNRAPATFDNTVLAMERSGTLLTRVAKVFFAITQANTNDTLQKVEEAEAPKLAAHQDAIYLNPKLFARVQAIYDHRDGLKPDQKFLVERYERDFVHAGAKLSEADKQKLRALNQEESKLSTEFQNRLLAAAKAGALVVSDKAELAGLSDGEIAAAAEAAKARKLDGKWVLPLQNTTQQPAQVELQDRAVRERLFKASTERAEHGDANDTRAIIQRLAQLRAEKAKLIGFPTYAAYALDTQMAKTPQNAEKLMTDMVPAVMAKAQGEADRMQALIDQQQGGFKLAPWDWQYYAEQVRKAEYALDESQIKPYFELDRVLKDGVFFAANKMYGLTFKERHDIPVYQPDVRVFQVYDKDGKPLALFYADYFKRDNKSGGAWMDSFVDQSGLFATRPVVFNVCNFTKPAPGQPALLSFDDVTTMFHEFGHALHGMFSNVQYPTLAGTNVPRDFVEFPSQFNEHWATEPSVFANYAKHYQTGAPMPQALVDKIKKSRTFNQGFATLEYLEAALLDMAWHTLPADAPLQDADRFEADALKRFGVAMPDVPPRYRSSYFAHIWGGGYSAGYYAYLWSEVLDHDAYYWFREHGGMTRENGQRFRDMVLSRGSTEDMAAMYRAFRGRDPSVEPLLEQRGLKPETTK